MRTLVDLNCEDLLLQLVFRYARHATALSLVETVCQISSGRLKFNE